LSPSRACIKDDLVRTTAVVNQKGGCGKTTTAINLAALFAKRGIRTLVVDMDPQAHCAAGLGVPESRIEYSIGDALLAKHTSHGAFDPANLIWEVSRNLYLAPSTMMLAALEAPGGGLHQLPDKDRRLESLLNLLAGRFDRCLVDCPPTIGLLTFNALRAAREALIPVETGFFSLRGAEKQWNTIQRMIHHIGRPIACHILATLHKPESQLACNILAALRRQFAGQIIPVVVREHHVLREAASFGQPIVEFAPESEACNDFNALADWLIEHAENPPVQIEVMSGVGISDGATGRGTDAAAAAGHQGIGGRFEMDGASAAAREVLHAAGQIAGTSLAPGGSRAAELVRRVHDLGSRRHRAETSGLARSDIQAQQVHAVSHDEAYQDQAELIAAPTETIEHALEGAVGALANPAADVLRTSAADAASGQPATIVGTPPNHNLLREQRCHEIEAHEAVPADVSHLYGCRQTSRGVLFVQPATNVQSISIAGDFNHWSCTATPLRYNPQLKVFEAIVELPPGTHQYRLVVDGQWTTDMYNQHTQLNSYGEPNSVVNVTGPGM
jgi:chromosome partitioning protein